MTPGRKEELSDEHFLALSFLLDQKVLEHAFVEHVVLSLSSFQ